MSVAAANLAGIVLALLTATAFAVYYLCVRLGTDDGEVIDMMLISLITNVAIMIPLVAVVHGIPQITWISVLAFAAAGLTGSFLARLLIITSVEAIGASRTAPVVSSNVFFASLLAILLFGERLTLYHLIGIVLIVAGVAAITWETAQESDPTANLRELGPSLALPIIGAMVIGVEPIFITIGLDGGMGVLPGVAIKAIAATIGFLLYLRYYGALRSDILQVSHNTKWYVGAGVTSTIGIVAVFAALEVAPVVLVVPLVQISPLIVVVLSAIFLPRRLERVTWQLVAGAIVVVVGAILVSVFAG